MRPGSARSGKSANSKRGKEDVTQDEKEEEGDPDIMDFDAFMRERE